jgi:hypothetical protein
MDKPVFLHGETMSGWQGQHEMVAVEGFQDRRRGSGKTVSLPLAGCRRRVLETTTNNALIN